MVQGRKEIMSRLAGHMDEFRRRGIKSLAIFGSVARNEATAASDVDLLVEFDRPLGLLEFFRVQHDIETLLGVDRVDLVMPKALKPSLRGKILAEAVNVA
jgi:predicted nucleotidyltransferase